jgi:2-polyprenyl-6-methoxyphenol hydroxylase-like FAD-dependent oxidoreductase
MADGALGATQVLRQVCDRATFAVMVERCEVLIVGGGPVGLLLACLLRSQQRDCRVLERRLAPLEHSRAIGIHPPSLELLDGIGLAGTFVEHGVAVRRGHAFANRRLIGSLDFGRCPPPFQFVLSLPQSVSEALLEQRLAELGPTVLTRGAEVVRIELDGERPSVAWRGDDGQQRVIEAELLVGCDGKRSAVRQAAGIPFDGAPYPDAFVMGDFDDNTDHGPEAAIHLHDEGLVECFPLPGGRRRWVVAVDARAVGRGEAPPRAGAERPMALRATTSAGELAQLVGDRLGHDLRGVRCHWVSTFGVQHHVARRLAHRRVALAGDAAHVVTPIGGQGMNLGWLGAAALAESLARHPADIDAAMAAYERVFRPVALKVLGRAERNMRLGRRWRLPGLRNALVWLLLHTPARKALARTFTMRGLARR